MTPFLEQDNWYKATYDYKCDGNQSQPGFRPWIGYNWAYPIKTYMCPSDPSMPGEGKADVLIPSSSLLPPGQNSSYEWTDTFGLTSYANNFQVFGIANNDGTFSDWPGQKRLTDITDGTSNTIFLVEKYARCGYLDGSPIGAANMPRGNCWDWWSTDNSSPYIAAGAGAWPLADPIGPISMFQVNPDPWLSVCDPTRASTSHPGNMNVLLGDGHVRTLAGSMDPNVWWMLLTPTGNEVIPDNF